LSPPLCRYAALRWNNEKFNIKKFGGRSLKNAAKRLFWEVGVIEKCNIRLLFAGEKCAYTLQMPGEKCIEQPLSH
jgi:hypothetical protein